MPSAERLWRAALAAAVGLSLLALASSWKEGRTRREELSRALPVLFSARDLSPGQLLTARDVELRHVPSSAAPLARLSAPEEAIGRPLSVTLPQGVPLRPTDLLPAVLLRPGERLIAVPLTGPQAGIPGLSPGSHVDVLATYDLHHSTVSSLVVQDVILHGLGVPPAPGLDAEGIAAMVEGPGRSWATLLVSVEDALRLAHAASFASDLHLLLRPPQDPSRPLPTEWRP